MEKSEKLGNVPNLRFPGFEGGWKEEKLGALCKMQAGKFINASEISNEFENDLFPCYGGNGLRGYAKTHNENGVFSLIGRQGALCGNITLSQGKFYATEHALVVRPTPSINTFFLYHLLNRLNLNQYATGAAQPGLSVQNLVNIPLFIPNTYPEQQNIAALLSKIDERIETQIKIIKELNVLNTNVSKRMFSGQFRFRDENGNSFPKWKEKKLVEIANIKSGLSKDQSGDSSGYKVTRIETISNGTINPNKIGYIDFKGNIDDYKIKKGDILFSNINSVSHIGKTAIAYSDLDLYHGMNLLCIKSKYELNPLFLYYYLNTVKIRNYFKSICNQAISQASINQTELGKMIIVFPVLKEQTKISNFFYSMYSKIDLETQLLQKLKQQKKFLLQQMFV